MNTNKVLLGGLAGGAAFFFLGWLFYGILLLDYLMANTNQCLNKPMEEMNMMAMILSNLAAGLVLAIIFNWSNTQGWMTGFRRGALLGALFGFSVNMSFHSMTNMYNSLTPMFVDVAAYTAMAAVAGAIIGLIMRKKETAEA